MTKDCSDRSLERRDAKLDCLEEGQLNGFVGGIYVSMDVQGQTEHTSHSTQL